MSMSSVEYAASVDIGCLARPLDTIQVMQPLTDDEAALLYTVQMWGSSSYPVQKLGRKWQWRDWRSVHGAPVAYSTKGTAVAAFEAWRDLALARWSEFKRAQPSAMLTAVGVGV